MAEYTAKDASGTTKYFKAQNTGSSGDGFEQDVNITDRAARDLGKVDIAAFDSALPAGTNNIGDVDIASALPAGNNNIGNVDIASALPAGTNNIGDVDIASFGASLPAGTNNIGDVDVLTGATDDAAAAGQIFPAAGLYQASGSVDEVDSGDVGRVRMSARRGLVTTPDARLLTLSSSTPVPTGSDITSRNTALVTGDFQIRDTSTHYFTIPMLLAGYKHLMIGMHTVVAFDQAATIQVDVASGLTGNESQFAKIIDFTMSALTSKFTISSAGAVGVGGVAGADPPSNRAFFSAPALQTAWYVLLTMQFSSAPSTGEIKIFVTRSS